ncbi:PH domain-containing protein [Streptomonospora sp. PA3]|uniref:PH domain-containing protein n=1 Tax=Streptomonospora sp. PA3 TaxID=2607326 RepID=UPI0012DBDB04|nr:PH domain-containing protein [Streptomonospora sp. PA3]MUL43550.1 PH domain-containing protein [Streptomonospora sp. PA3]
MSENPPPEEPRSRPGETERAGGEPPAGAGYAPRDPEHPAAPQEEAAAPGPGSGHEAAAEAEPAYRLSPLTLLTSPLNYLRSYLVPVVVALIAGTYSFNPWMLGGAAVAIAAMVLSGLVTWYTFRYQVGAERLEIRRGLINRSHRSIPLERIRGVDISSNPLHRMLGLAVVKIEAAAGGGGSEEGKLDAVTAEEAERLRRVLLRRRAHLRGEESAPAPAAAAPVPGGAAGPDESDTEVYFAMPASWYGYAVFSLGYLLTPFVALATLFGLISQGLGEAAGDRVGDTAYDLYRLAAEMAFSLLVAVAAVLVLVLLVAMPLFAVVSYALTHWRFTLLRRGDALVAERGLLTRQSVTLEKRRIRGHELLDNPLERTRSAVRLRAIVTGLGETATRAVLMPIGPRRRVEEVADRALTAFRGTLVRHPRAALGRRLLRAVAPFAVAAAAAAFLAPLWVAVLLALPALLGVPLGVDRYRSLGHGDDGRQVSVRSGSLRRVQAVVVRDAIIGWTWRQTLFQRRAGLADLELSVGAGSGGYSAIDASFTESVAFARGVTPEMVRPFLESGEPTETAESTESGGLRSRPGGDDARTGGESG